MRESIRRSLKYTFATNILTGPVAQRLEQGTHNPLVVGSNPTGPTNFFTSKVDCITYFSICHVLNTLLILLWLIKTTCLSIYLYSNV